VNKADYVLISAQILHQNFFTSSGCVTLIRCALVFNFEVTLDPEEEEKIFINLVRALWNSAEG